MRERVACAIGFNAPVFIFYSCGYFPMVFPGSGFARVARVGGKREKIVRYTIGGGDDDDGDEIDPRRISSPTPCSPDTATPRYRDDVSGSERASVFFRSLKTLSQNDNNNNIQYYITYLVRTVYRRP